MKLQNIIRYLKYSTQPLYKPVSHVIFDLDGIILDTETRYFELYKKTVEKLGHKDYSIETHTMITGRGESEGFKMIIDKLKLNITIEQFGKIKKNFLNESLANIQFKAGAERLIHHLHENKVPLAIATSSAQYSYDFKVGQHVDFFRCFHHAVLGSDPELKRSKPAPDIFLLAAERFPDSPQPDKCLVFEDSPSGIRAGLAAGMQVVAIPEGHMPKTLFQGIEPTLFLASLELFQPQLFSLPPYPQSSEKP